MHRMIKFIYCLQLGKQELSEKINYYAMFTTLIDQRTLSVMNFRAGRDNASFKLLDYIMYKDQKILNAKKRYFDICEHFEFDHLQDDDWKE